MFWDFLEGNKVLEIIPKCFRVSQTDLVDLRSQPNHWEILRISENQRLKIEFLLILTNSPNSPNSPKSPKCFPNVSDMLCERFGLISNRSKSFGIWFNLWKFSEKSEYFNIRIWDFCDFYEFFFRNCDSRILASAQNQKQHKTKQKLQIEF